MNIINTLTLRHLKANKGRTIITILGITVAVAMITGLFLCMASFLNFFAEISYIDDGRYHGYYTSVPQKTSKQLEQDDRLDEVGIEQDSISEDAVTSYQISSDASEIYQYGELKYLNKQAFKMRIMQKYEGTLPQRKNEIAISKKLLERNKLSYHVGDSITLSLGTRSMPEEEGSIVTGSYQNGETFTKSGVETYKITAIFGNSAGSYDKIYAYLDQMDYNDNQTVYFTLKHPGVSSLRTTNQISKDYHLTQLQKNEHFYLSVFAIDKEDGSAKMFLSLTFVLLIIIMIASVSLIYNAFHISLSERVRYLGMLSSVGATKQQKRASIFFEAFLLGVISIPLGLLGGYLGIAITFHFLSDTIVSTISSDIAVGNLNIVTVVPGWAIVLILISSAFTIFIAAWIPAVKASKITPIDALRQNSEIKVKARKLRSPFYIRKLFGYEGELAHKSLKRNGRKSRTIVVSLVVSIVLFLTVNYFCDIFMQMNRYSNNSYYDVSCIVGWENKDVIKEKLEEEPDAEEVAAYNTVTYTSDRELYENSVSIDGYVPLSNLSSDCFTVSYRNLKNETYMLKALVVPDDVFDRICKNNKLDFPKLADSIPVILYNSMNVRKEAPVFTKEMIGQKLTIEKTNSDSEKMKLTYEVIGFTNAKNSDFLKHVFLNNQISFVMRESDYEFYCNTKPSELPYQYWIKSEKHEQLCQSLLDYLAEHEQQFKGSYSVWDVTEQSRAINGVAMVLRVLVNGFIVLISLIALANIVNSISTGVILRRKEFAMLKSVGTTPKGFRKMIYLESAFYGIKALLLGIPVSIFLSYLLLKVTGETGLAFIIDVKLYLIVIVTVFLIIGISMFYAMRKIKDDSIVETLKLELN